MTSNVIHPSVPINTQMICRILKAKSNAVLENSKQPPFKTLLRVIIDFSLEIIQYRKWNDSGNKNKTTNKEPKI